MSDRWTRAGERSRRRSDEQQRRYRRGGAHRSTTDEWDDYEDDDTAVIPRYVDEDEQGAHYAESAALVHGAHAEPGHAHGEYDDRDYGPGYDERAYEGVYDDPVYDDPGYDDPAYDAEYAEAAHTGGHRYRPADYDSEQGFEPVAAEEVAEPPTRTRAERGAATTGSLRAAQRASQRGTKRSTSDTSTRSSAKASRAPERPGRPGKSSRSGGSRGRRSRMASRKAAERQRRRRNLVVLGCVFVVLFLVAGGYAGYKFIRSMGGPEDFDGPPGPLAVVQVHTGDTAEQIAQTMVTKGVVKSTGAFYQAAVRNSGITSVQPGYYAVPTHSKGADAVTALMTKSSRVGNVVVSEGRRLHDSTDVNTGARNDGIYRKIADASCVGTGAAKKCVTYEQLDAAGANPDLAALGVPAWAIDAVRQVPDRTRQLEGLIAAGTWDFDPSGTPEQILAQLVSESAASYETTGLLQSGTTNKLDPYRTLIAASLVEREALPQDMSKVARVIVNRLAVDQPLQLDSTVNYTLDRTEVATTDADRERKTPWNTYAMSGLPATPISSPSLDAMRAMENPTPGPWLYFVTVDKQGTTLFTDSYSEHLRNIQRAQQSGILDSGR